MSKGPTAESENSDEIFAEYQVSTLTEKMASPQIKDAGSLLRDRYVWVIVFGRSVNI